MALHLVLPHPLALGCAVLATTAHLAALARPKSRVLLVLLVLLDQVLVQCVASGCIQLELPRPVLHQVVSRVMLANMALSLACLMQVAVDRVQLVITALETLLH